VKINSKLHRRNHQKCNIFVCQSGSQLLATDGLTTVSECATSRKVNDRQNWSSFSVRLLYILVGNWQYVIRIQMKNLIKILNHVRLITLLNVCNNAAQISPKVMTRHLSDVAKNDFDGLGVNSKVVVVRSEGRQKNRVTSVFETNF
jgi:hypothetical protein